MPTKPEQGWAGNAQRLEVKSFRVGRVTSLRNSYAKIYVEFVPRRGRKVQGGVQSSKPTLVILNGWGHPDAPNCWIDKGNGLFSARHTLFASEWRIEMDAFLADYLRVSPSVVVLADYREDQSSRLKTDAMTITQHDVEFLGDTTKFATSKSTWGPESVYTSGTACCTSDTSNFGNGIQRNSSLQKSKT